MIIDELWDINQVAEYLNLSSDKSAAKQLTRFGIRAREYRPTGHRGAPNAFYSSIEIRTANQRRPSRSGVYER